MWLKQPLVTHSRNILHTQTHTIINILDSDVIMRVMASQITRGSIVCSTVCSGADKKNIKAPRRRLCEGNPSVTCGSPHKRPVTRNTSMLPFDDVIMYYFPDTRKISQIREDCPGWYYQQWDTWTPGARYTYRKTFSISRTKFQSLNVSCVLLQLSSLNPLKPGVKLLTQM